MNNLGIEYTEKKLEEFKTVDDMLEDIGRKVKTMPQIKIKELIRSGTNPQMKTKELIRSGANHKFWLCTTPN